MKISRVCGHTEDLYFGTQEAYLNEKKRFNCLCIDCKNQFEISRQEVDKADEAAEFLLNSDKSLPQPGYVYHIPAENVLLQVMRDFTGNFWLRRFPDFGDMPFMPWIKDQDNLVEYLASKSAVLIDKYI